MSRRYGLVLVLALSAAGLNAAILPEQFGAFKKVSTAKLEVADRPVWNEYGLESAERGEYEGSGKKVGVSVWRLKDTTGAWAAQQWLQSGAVQHGNYVIQVEGSLRQPDLAELRSKLPEVDRAANPGLLRFLPERGRVKGSERYVLGAQSLAKFEGRVPADLAGFHKGAEGQIARYKTKGGEAQLLLFSYPTPQIAGERFREFEKRSDLRARRHGPMVAAAFDATPEEADKLLASVSYQPRVSWSEHVPKFENPGDMILAICMLAGALIVASVVLGMMMGGYRQLFGSKFGVQAIDQNFTSLHLGDKK